MSNRDGECVMTLARSNLLTPTPVLSATSCWDSAFLSTHTSAAAGQPWKTAAGLAPGRSWRSDLTRSETASGSRYISPSAPFCHLAPRIKRRCVATSVAPVDIHTWLTAPSQWSSIIANEAERWRIPSAWYPMRVPSRDGSWNHSRFQNRSFRLGTCACSERAWRVSLMGAMLFSSPGRTVSSQSSSIFAKEAERCRIPSTPHTPYCRASSSFACELYLSRSSPAPNE
mmetsp:Transcript_12099/g.56167  ORF Transcript_12099/g.56167 Transcript_12099/m.56167 type:complete len:228 (+) Transcript_12099:2408-3091(+)